MQEPVCLNEVPTFENWNIVFYRDIFMPTIHTQPYLMLDIGGCNIPVCMCKYFQFLRNICNDITKVSTVFMIE